MIEHVRFTGAQVFFCVVLSLMVGCGGGGGGNNSNNNSNNTPAPQVNSPQGVYQGTASNASHTINQSFETIILPNNTVYGLYGALSGNTFIIYGLVTGQGSSTSSTYSANITDFYYTGQIFTGSVSANYVAASSVNGTVTEPANGTTTFNGNAIPASQFNYNTAAHLSDISGSWVGALLDGSAASVSISSNGSFTGSNSGCSFSGSISPDSSGKNFFTISMTFGTSGCSFPGQTATGAAVDYLLSDGVTRQVVAAVSSGTAPGTAFGTVFVANSGTASVTISAPSNTVKVGSTLQFSAVAKDASGNVIQNAVFQWSSSASSIVTIDSNGVATGVSAGGPITITASSGGISSGPFMLTVTQN